MSEREIDVYVDLDRRAIPAGRLFLRVLRGRESATFTYHEDWLSHPERFSLDPVRLLLGDGAFNTGGDLKLFTGLSDSAPDRWGRNLMAQQVRLEGERRTLFEHDYLYLEIADAIRVHGVRVERNLQELWRRMVFNVLVSNTDDHLRNHGFLRSTGGWDLSPAYDLNPVPVDVRPRIHALALDDQNPRSSLATLLEVADYLGLPQHLACEIARGVGLATAKWRRVARSNGLDATDVERMTSAFEHEDLDLALGLP